MHRDIVIVLVLTIVGISIGWFARDFFTKKGMFLSSASPVNTILNPDTIPRASEIKLLPVIGIGSTNLIAGENPESGSLASIQILSAFAQTIVEEVKSADPLAPASYKTVGVRVMGEVKNSGKDLVKMIAPVVNFYDKDGKVLASKRASINPASPFVPLKVSETGGYDVIVRDPPETMEKIEVKLAPIQVNDAVEYVNLKLKDKNLVTHESGSDSAQLTYYQFQGTLINDGANTVVDPTILVWVKNETGKVIAMDSKSYADDLIAVGKEYPVSFLITSRIAVKAPIFEVRTFGKKYDK